MFGNSEYEDKCGSCEYYDCKESCMLGRCDYSLDMHYPDDDSCYHYLKKFRDAYINDYDEEDIVYCMRTMSNEKVSIKEGVSTLKTLSDLNLSITKYPQESKAKVYKLGEMPKN